ncbi:hypothetical protein MK280_18250 [Myxococcota bacterium]|nr:hypothetical protein [Myxococcota bacterium]
MLSLGIVNQRQSTLNDFNAGPPSLRPAVDPEPVSWVALPPRVMTWNVSRLDIPVAATVEADRLGGGTQGIRSPGLISKEFEIGGAALAAAWQGSGK